MCGIAGRFSPQGIPENSDWARQASYLLRHRGPDGDGFYKDNCCELVHRRLAIIDLTSTGEQPMASADGRTWIVYNGEIYGYNNLRQELFQKGYPFRGTSDTEVLLALYQLCGIDMLSQLRGIFAFAIYDPDKRSLFLARDRFGTKPLYYAMLDGQLIFASEIKAIAAWPGFKPEIDHQAVYDFLSWGYIPEPATGFKNIQALPKGSYLHVTPEGQVMQHYYQVTPHPAFTGTADEAAEAVAERLQDAIRVQQVADVPVGSLLSGGIDSGLVTTAYAKVTTHPFYTFTVGFPDAEYDERALANQTAKALGTQHSVISLENWRLDTDAAVDLLAHFDQPFSDTSLFAVNLVAKGIHDSGLRCALSGDGGDEAFGGYAFFSHLTRLLPLHQLPGPARSLASVGSQIVLGRRSPGRARQIRRALDIAGSPSPSEFLTRLTSYQTEAQKTALVLPAARDGLQPVGRLYEPFEHGWGMEDVAAQLTSGMFDLLLPGDMLKKVDMMSMRNSVEIRVPMLDEALVEFATGLPYRLKSSRAQNKIVLRTLASRWLPPEVSAARKRGFGIPLDVLAAQSLKEAIRESLLALDARTRAFIDQSLVSRWVQQFERSDQSRSELEVSREGLYQRLFFLLSLETWMRRYALNW